MKLLLHSTLFTIFIIFSTTAGTHQKIKLNPIGNFRTGVYLDGASEIVAYDPLTKRVFSENAHEGAIDVISIQDPTNPTLLFSIDLSPYGKGANSVDVYNGILVAAVENVDKQDNGRLVLFRTYGNCPMIRQFEIGPLPDMTTFTPDGKFVLVANEGEPNDDYSIDPEGSISILDLRRGIWRAKVKTADFHRFNPLKDQLNAQGIRVYGPNSSVSQDFEPEYITVSDDSRTAWVTLQENNAIAVIDIANAYVKRLLPLGFKDHSKPYNKLDASNEDGAINITNWPVFGMYLPDAIGSFKFMFRTYLVTANEGDSRDYSGFSEEERVADVVLDPTVFPDAADLQKEENLGRLKITNTMGDTDGDGDYDKLFSYGARSFSIWTDDGHLIYDSGSKIEEITAQFYPADFNSNDEENNSFDDRSDDKGPEPEGVAIAVLKGRTYAFIGLERIGGIMTFDVTNPYKPEFMDYVNTRDFSGDPENDTAGDLAPEGLKFIPAWLSPSHRPLLLAAYEVSGSVGIFEIETCTTYTEPDKDNQHISVRNFPNPFNPTTDIFYNLPQDMKVNIAVYNILGQKVSELVNGFQTAGDHKVRFNGTGLSSGLYVYVLQAGDFRQVNKFLLTK